MNKKNKMQLFFIWVTVVALLVLLTALSYGWFTFNSALRVEPMTGETTHVGNGTGELLIANAKAGPFDTECDLVLAANPEVLQPVSTAGLLNFYQTTAQNREGISIQYRDITGEIDNYLLRGTIYLKSTGGSSEVYLLPSTFQITTDVQTMAALRLGLRIQVENGEEKLVILKLDELASGAAESTRTVPTADTVVRAINASGTAEYTQDPSESVRNYMAVEGSNVEPKAAAKQICTIDTDQIATVDYWLYLEGCDDNCLKSLQNHPASIKFGFVGISKEAA